MQEKTGAGPGKFPEPSRQSLQKTPLHPVMEVQETQAYRSQRNQRGEYIYIHTEEKP
jgi:hypothetical protein